MSLRNLLRVGATIAVVDFLFATCLTIFYHHSTFARLWKGVAAVPFGRQALQGGAEWVIAGIIIHVVVSFTWSAVFLAAVRARWVRRVLESPFGRMKVAIVYGPAIWLVMSLIVIAPLTRRTPAIDVDWWIQMVGHIFFVALPIAWATRAATR